MKPEAFTARELELIFLAITFLSNNREVVATELESEISSSEVMKLEDKLQKHKPENWRF